MKFQRFFPVFAGVLVLILSGAGGARASEVLYSSSGFVTGTESFLQSFDVTTPGTLTVTLTNVNWPVQLASLDVLLTNSSGAIAPMMGSGTESFQIGAGKIFAQWFGQAQGPLNTGVYSLQVAFQPSAVTVPLPTSVLLLLSGLALLAWQRRAAHARPASSG